MPNKKQIKLSFIKKNTTEVFWEQFSVELYSALAAIYLGKEKRLIYKRCLLDKYKKMIRCEPIQPGHSELLFSIPLLTTTELSLTEKWVIDNSYVLSAILSTPSFRDLAPVSIHLACGTLIDFNLDKQNIIKLQSYPDLSTRFSSTVLNANKESTESMQKLENMLDKIIEYPIPNNDLQKNPTYKTVKTDKKEDR